MKRLLVLTLLASAFSAHAQRIGEVDTVFKLIGPDHKIVVDAHDDPEVSVPEAVGAPGSCAATA
jgi:CreA protein